MSASEVPFKLKNNASLLVAGSTGSGKSTVVTKLLHSQHKLFDHPFDNIILCYSVLNQGYLQLLADFPNLKLHDGFPTDILENPENYLDKGKFNCLILEDLQFSFGQGNTSNLIAKLFGVISHHYNLFSILVVQNIFLPIRDGRTISRNAKYIILTATAHLNSVATLGQQLFSNGKFLLEAFKDATRSSNRYLFLNLDPFLPNEQLKVVTGIFETEKTHVYLPK